MYFTKIKNKNIYIYIKKQQKTKNIGKEIRFVGLEVAMRKEKWDEGDPKV